jgi:8-oxo-dGTP pyrophosphatase MutT (NUDIX family)
MKKNTSAMTITVRNGKLLILKDRRGRWTLPGGQIDKGEKAREAAVRETYEETGINVVIFGKSGETGSYSKGRKKAIIFFASTSTKKINLSHEHKKYKWVDPSTAKKKLISRHANVI